MIEHEGLKRKTLTELVVENIKLYILNNKLKPGDKLPSVAELMKMFKVSRSTVLGAMRQLQASNIIVTKTGVGAIIKEFDISAIFKDFSWNMYLGADNRFFLELLEARKMFELMILPLVLERIGREYLDKLSDLVSNMEKVDNIDEYREYDKRFHMLLVESTNNRPLIEMGKVILEFFQKIRILFPYKKGAISVSLKEHKKIVELCKQGNFGELHEVMSRHLERYKAWLESNIEEG